MKSAILRKFLTIIVVSLALVAAREAFSQVDPDSVKATPIEIPDKSKPVIKTKPSVGATPIEIPDKSKPVIKTKPSVGATPIEIPGKK